MLVNFEKNITFLFFMLVVGATMIFANQANAVSIKNNVSTSVNTGGNSGDSVETGSASVKSSVKTQISQEGARDVSTQITVQANEKKKEVGLQGEGNISVQVEATDDNQSGIRIKEFENKSALAVAPAEQKQNFLVKTEKFFKRLTNWLKNIL